MRPVAVLILFVAFVAPLAALRWLRWLRSRATRRSWAAAFSSVARSVTARRRYGGRAWTPADQPPAGVTQAAAGIVDPGPATGHTGDRESELLIERWGRLVSPSGTIERARPVLVVEDNDDIRNALRIGLETDGFETIGAPDGREALDMATETPPQAILLDLELPRLSGREFLEQWRREESSVSASIPVVVVSGRKDAATIADEIGADAVVPKPVDLDALSVVLHDLTDPHSAEPGPGEAGAPSSTSSSERPPTTPS